MNMREQEYILALNNFRSITQAAESLHITQPALSIFLSKLETSIDMPLFERIGKTLIPTKAGEVYISYAQHMVTLNADFELAAASLKKELKGELHIGCLQKRMLFLMPRLIRNFRKTHPGITVYSHSAQPESLVHDLIHGNLDLIYTNRDFHIPELNSLAVRSDHLLLLLSADHPAISYSVEITGENYSYLDLQYLEDETFYIMDPRRSVGFLADNAIRYSNIHPADIRNVASIDIGCQMAAEGLGISFTTESYIKDFIYPTPHRCFLTGDLSSNVTWKIMWRKTMPLTSYMKDFMEALKRMQQNEESRQN